MKIGLLPLIAPWWCLVAGVQSHASSTHLKSGPPPLFKVEQIVGRYSLGRGVGLTINANNTFAFTWHSCCGEVDRNSGTWNIDGDVLVLQPERPYKQKGFSGTGTRYVPVPWGRRLYLVDENGVAGFAAAAGGSGRRQLRYSFWDYEQVSQVTGQTKALDGKPVLPERYQPFYDHGPVRAMVIEL
ncbi:MAG TPA: hypothetical protein VEX38_05350, partial [Fimbriimonadaceae bacterium]|nr:hypothetical protein [Fimbriimonadaceae bacterium]